MASRGTETILVVEDDPALRQITRVFLESSGYTVLEAPDPAEAIRLASNFQKTIHCLLTDFVLPGMNGHELARQLIEVRPQMKVLYVSGYTDEAFSRNSFMEPGAAFLQKPYSRLTLTRKIREVLDAVPHEAPKS